MNNEELQGNLLGQPQTILKFETDYIVLSKDYADHIREMNDIKAHVDADVASNKALKNVDERKMSTLSQLDADKRYQELKKATPDEDLAIKKLFAKIRFERDMLEVYQTIGKMKAGGV